MEKSLELKQELEKSASELVISQVFKRIDTELKILNSSTETNLDWFVRLTNVLMFGQHAEVGFALVRAVGLAVAEKHWDELPINIRLGYGMNFMTYAQATMPDKDYSTIRNWINTAKTWVLDGGIQPNCTIEVPERGIDGRPVKEGERVKTKVVEFSPYEVSITKLTYANAVAKEGKLTPKLWSMLADKDVSCESFRAEIVTRPSGHDDFEDIKFLIQGPMLCATRYGEIVELGEITCWDSFYYGEESLEKDAIKRLLGLLGIKLDEQVIFEQERQMNASTGNGHPIE